MTKPNEANPPDDPGEVLKVPDVARLLKVGPFAVRRMIRDGEIPAAKLGVSWFVLRSELLRVLAGKQGQASATSATPAPKPAEPPTPPSAPRAIDYLRELAAKNKLEAKARGDWRRR